IVSYIGVFILGIIFSPLLVSFFHKTGYFINVIKSRETLEILRNENKKLKEKVNSIEKNGIIIKNITPILEIGMLKVDFEITRYYDFFLKRDKKDQEFNAVDSKKEAQLRFIGGFRSKFTAKYGIDLTKIKIELDEERKIIYVSNFEPKMSGLADFAKDEWLGANVLEKTPNILDKTLSQWSIKENHKNLDEVKELFRKLFDNNRAEELRKIGFLKEPLKKQALEMIKLLLGRTSWEIKELDSIRGKEIRYLLNRDKSGEI
ncbi:hypothetical protein J7L48_03890, partial [bacterium]|nr:hypothetical protein [bacterium]